MNGATDFHPKTTGAGLALTLAGFVVWLLTHWIVVPPTAAVGLAAVFGVVGAWLAPVLANERAKLVTVTGTPSAAGGVTIADAPAPKKAARAK